MRAVLLVLACGAALWSQDAKKVSRTEAMAAVVTRVNPEYPSAARQLRIEGSVEIDLVIDERGGVEKAEIRSGNAILTKAAVAALKKWKFKPFITDGKAVKAEATVSVTFKL